ncbi:MAG TPA: type 4a pilus biogenesis protein PilO [Planctomycetota bacterium]|jgi:Tfp pilus assembly protein PilO|nr:type 4a pilus biogenesis protein PilO [Planctomycetota bacterium]
MNEKQFTIIWIVALSLILIAGGAAIYYLQFEVLEQKKQELTVVQGQVLDATKKKNAIPGLRSSIAELEKKEAELITHIPNLTRAEYDGLAELLDDLRRKSGVSVSKASWVIPSRASALPGRPPQPPTVHKVQYDLSVTGNFYQLLRYVNLLEQNRRFMGVESFTVSKGPAAEGKTTTLPKRELRITIYSYTYKLPPTPFVINADEVRSGKSTDLPE